MSLTEGIAYKGALGGVILIDVVPCFPIYYFLIRGYAAKIESSTILSSMFIVIGKSLKLFELD